MKNVTKLKLSNIPTESLSWRSSKLTITELTKYGIANSSIFPINVFKKSNNNNFFYDVCFS